MSGASGYLVDEWINGAWTQIGSFGSGSTSYSVTGLSPGTTYYFRRGCFQRGRHVLGQFPKRHDRRGRSGGPSRGGDRLHSRQRLALRRQRAVLPGRAAGGRGRLLADGEPGRGGGPGSGRTFANMFTAAGTTVENGATVSLYKVRFFNSAGVAEYVTVDTELPSGGGYYDHPANGVLWVALAEKAYAEANGAGIVTTGNVGSDSYDALNGGDPAWALQAITGKSASDFSINPTNIAAAWNAGELIVLGSSTTRRPA